MIYLFAKRIISKFKYYLFRLFCTPGMLSCGRRSYVELPFRIDGQEFISIGDNSVIQSRAWLYCQSIDESSATIKVGSNCVIGYNNHITSVKEVVIEDNVLTANNVYISDNIHEYDNINLPIINQPIKFKGVVRIGQGSWLGENVCIIGVTIGRNCVIGANSVVTHDVPDYSVVVGAPGKVIRQYDYQKKRWVDK